MSQNGSPASQAVGHEDVAKTMEEMVVCNRRLKCALSAPDSLKISSFQAQIRIMQENIALKEHLMKLDTQQNVSMLQRNVAVERAGVLFVLAHSPFSVDATRQPQRSLMTPHLELRSSSR